MSDTPQEEYSIVNAMLPTKYYPELQNNTYQRVAASIAAQLFPDVEMVGVSLWMMYLDIRYFHRPHVAMLFARYLTTTSC